MTERDRDDAPSPEETESRLDAALGAFKPRRKAADNSLVSESGRSGMTWSPVTDTGTGDDTDTGTESEARQGSSFQFDLGSALARLGGAAEPPPSHPEGLGDDPSTDSLPVRSRQADAGPEAPVAPTPRDHADAPSRLPSRGQAETSGSTEPLPTRGQPTPSDRGATTSEQPTVVDRLPTRTPRSEPPTDPRPADVDRRPEEPERPAVRPQPSNRSVFDDANPSPILPAAGAPTLPSQQPSPPLGKITPAGDGSVQPHLPAPLPAAPPPVIAPIESAPSTPDLNALRSAQLRASRNDRRGKLFGRSLLALIVVGGIVAAALLFGRAYLFPTKWDPELTPLVDELQSARDVEFDDTVPMVERTASEYAPLVTDHVLGAEWNTRLPEWRALGLAGGDGAVADVQVRVAALYPAFFDADSETIIVSADRSTDSREPALRLALESALASQLDGDGDAAVASSPLGLTGLDPIERTARRAVDAAAAGLAASAPEALADLEGVPVPVAYQLRATDDLGAALIEASTRPSDPLPAAVERLDDDASTTVGGLRQPDDQQVLEPVALGSDDWAMIWAARLSPAIAGPMADSLVADSYSVVSRSGVTCFIAVFETGTDVAGTSLLADLTSWAAAAPATARATATPLAPNRAQLEACDPGADAASQSATGAVDLVVRRQLDRLATG